MTEKHEYACAKKISNKVKTTFGLEDMDSEEEQVYEEWQQNRLQSISN